MSDPVERFRTASDEMARHYAGLSRAQAARRAALEELRGSGLTMQAIADAVGVTRQRLYEILGPIHERRRPGPKAVMECSTCGTVYPLDALHVCRAT